MSVSQISINWYWSRGGGGGDVYGWEGNRRFAVVVAMCQRLCGVVNGLVRVISISSTRLALSDFTFQFLKNSNYVRLEFQLPLSVRGS